MFSLNRFLDLLLEAVKAYNPDNECRQINTFAILQSVDDLNKTDLGMKGDDLSNEFWVRGCATAMKVDYKYPLLSVYDNNGKINCPFVENERTGERTSIQYDLKIAIFDLFKREKKGCNGCSGRSETQIFEDTTYSLLEILSYFKKVKVYRVTELDGTKHFGFYNVDFLSECKLRNEILDFESLQEITYDEKINLSAIECNWYDAMCSGNENLDFTRFIHETKDDLIGTVLNVRIPEVFCDYGNFEFDKSEREIKFHKCCL